MEKIVFITLLYLSFFGEIKMESFEIVSDMNCESWYQYNVNIIERKKRKLFTNHYYHEYKGKQVIGYVCGNEPPQ